MINIEWHNKKFTFPESWEEMTEKQFLDYTSILGTLLFHENITEQEIYARRLIALQKIMGVPVYLFQRANADEFLDLLKLLDFTKEIDINVQLVPSVKIKTGLFKRLKLVGPDKGLDTSIFDEFILADTYFVNISKQKNIDLAYHLFAILYRPVREDLKEFRNSPQWNGDVREPFNATKCKERVPMLKKYLPRKYLIAVLYFYWGFREKNLLVYKTLFPDPPKEKGNSEQTQKQKNSYGWAATRLELSGHKFGNYQQTGQENWHNIIFDMHREEEKRVKREKELAIARHRQKSRS